MVAQRDGRMKSPLSVTKWGSGHANFVGLHGWGGSHKTFVPLINYLPEGIVIEAPDLPGCGQSSLPDRWRVETIADMVSDSISFESGFTIIGNCTGGVIGAEIARIKPDLVERLVMIDPFAYSPWYFALFLKGNFGRVAYRTAFASPIGRFFTNMALSGKRDGDTDLTSSFERVDHDAVYSFLKMMGEHEGPSRYAGLALPIDIIIGENTFRAVEKSAAILGEVWPHATLRVIQGAGHLPIEERSETLANLVFNYE